MFASEILTNIIDWCLHDIHSEYIVEYKYKCIENNSLQIINNPLFIF